MVGQLNFQQPPTLPKRGKEKDICAKLKHIDKYFPIYKFDWIMSIKLVNK